MSIDSDIAVEDSDMIVSELHTKYATPRRLSRELKGLLGDSAQFKVEMRHNVYNIKSSKPVDVETLLSKCQTLHRTKPPNTETERKQVSSSQTAKCTT